MERRICFGVFRRRCEDAPQLAAGCFTLKAQVSSGESRPKKIRSAKIESLSRQNISHLLHLLVYARHVEDPKHLIEFSRLPNMDSLERIQWNGLVH
jgi:hypothetical protein